MAIKKKNNFIDNKDLEKELLIYIENRKNGNGKIHEELGKMFILMVEHFSYHRNFINYTEDWMNDMKSDAIYNCIRYSHNFNPEKGTGFNYITSCIWNGFLARVNLEKKKGKRLENIKDQIFNDFLVHNNIYSENGNHNEDEDWG